MNRHFRLASIAFFCAITPFVILRAAEPAAPADASAQEAQYREVAQQIRLFGDVFREVNRQYVDDIAPTDFIKAGIDGMLGTLDPYTTYFEPDNTDQIEEITLGKYGGVGIEIGTRGKDRELTVISPIEDTPAARKGIRAGDVIVGVDGKSTAGFTTQDATKLIRGLQGTSVTLSIRRAGFDKPLDYTLTREEIRIHDVAYSGIIEGDIGYIKLAHFSSLAGNELDSSLSAILTKKPKGLILDLRSNPGGLLPAAIAVSNQFLAKGDPIVSTKGRTPNSTRVFPAAGNPKVPDLPLVVLINGGSASASEIVSGAIQDLDRGVIVGTQSFGKGLVQSVYNMQNGSILKVTTARYYTPSGRLIQRDRPKRGAMLGPEEEEEDPDLPGALTRKEGAASSDTSTEKYATRSGRKVFGGGGITPDVTVELPLLDPVAVEMFRKDLFFGFVNDWLTTHGRPDTVKVSDEMVSAFYEFLDSTKFEPPIPGADQLKALRQIGEKDSLGAEYFAQIDELKRSLARTVSLQTPELREFVVQSLDREMASALGGRDWRTRSTFDEDTQLKEAVKVLRDRTNYATLLGLASSDRKKN